MSIVTKLIKRYLESLENMVKEKSPRSSTFLAVKKVEAEGQGLFHS